MNFGISSGFSTTVRAVSVGTKAVMNYSTKDEPDSGMDYSDPEDDDNNLTFGELIDLYNYIANPEVFWGKFLGESFFESVAKNVNTKFVIEKGTTTVGWATTKWVWADLGKTIVGEKAKSNFGWLCVSVLITAVGEGVHKGGIKGLSGLFSGDEKSNYFWTEFGKGATKALTSGIVNGKKDDIIKAFLKAGLPKNLSPDDLGEILKTAKWQPGKSGSFWNRILNKDTRQFKQNSTSKGVKKFSGVASGSVKSVGYVASNLGFAFGVDYLTGLASNIVGGLMDGDELTWDEVGLGSTALKSSTKIIFATAGEIAFGKVGKIVGTAIGAYIGEFQVAAFKDENGNVQEGWCAVAAGAQLVGAVAGVAIIACLVSNPAGWVVGAALIVGAAVGFALTWAAHELVENWDKITAAVDNVLETAEEVVEEVVEFVEDVVDYVEDVVEDIGDAVKSNPVTNFLIGWAF